MNDPDYKRHVSDGAEAIAEEIHEAAIEAIVSRIMFRVKRGDDYRLTAIDKWMLETLQEAGYLRDDLERVIAERTGIMQAEIFDAFEDAAVRNIEWDNEVYRAAGLDPLPFKQSPYLQWLMVRNYEKTADQWKNFTGTFADKAQQLFIRECDRAYHLVSSGVMSYSQAIREAVERVSADGVVVEYTRLNKKGQLEVYHRDTIETATFRAVRTGVGQACSEITDARMEELDWDIILVSAHLGARTGDGGDNWTNHYWWQGKFYSRTGRDKRFPRFDVCGEEYVDGFGGPNCRHSKGPGDGIHNPFSHFDSEENRRREEMEQRQRLLERRIRKLKREVLGAKTAMDNAPDEETLAEMKALYQKKALKLQEKNKEYNEFCEVNDLRPYRERLAIAKWDRKQAAAAAGAAKRATREKTDRETLAGGLGRRTKNSGVFSHLPERMSKKHIREIAKEFDIPLKGVKIKIDADEDKLKESFRYAGRADPYEVGRIDFFPKAFVSKEELIRTLFHEGIHVQQFREYGAEYVENNRGFFEDIAYDAERAFIEKLKEEGIL